jgi:hypothetical protein
MEGSRDNPVDVPRGGMDAWLKPIHRWVWRDPLRRAYKLLAFAETEADGGRDLARAAEMTPDANLRRLYIRHAMDEQRHAEMFRRRGRTMLSTLRRRQAVANANWLSPGERSIDGVVVEKDNDEALLALLHLSERAAAARFAIYRDVLGHDPDTRAVFTRILRDEVFHMSYSRQELERIAPRRHGLRLWAARLHRIWKAYLRVATAIAGVIGTCVLAIQYFVLLPWFALLAKRAARRLRGDPHRDAPGWTVRGSRVRALRTQY